MKNSEYQSDVELLREILTELKTINKKMSDGKQATNHTGIIDNADLIQILKITSRTANYWRDSGKLKFSKVGRKIYYQISDIEALVQRKIQ